MKSIVDETTSGSVKGFLRLIYINAFIIGALIMALEMIGSRFLTPFFGNSVFTWASIISMVLLALAIGYFVGGSMAEKRPDILFVANIVLLASFLMLLIPFYFEDFFKFIYKQIGDIKLGGFIGAVSILFLPLSLLGIYSPYSVKLAMKHSDAPGKISGTIYAISTIGSIIGTIGVTFWLIPHIGSKSIVVALSFIGFLSAVTLTFLHFNEKEARSKATTITITALITYFLFFIVVVYLPEIKHTLGIKDFQSKYIKEEVESNYNHIIIKQKGEYVTMSFTRYKSKYTESKINIFNDNELPVSYTQLMPLGVVYAPDARKLLMIGFGGGMICKYIHKHFPEIDITGVELDNKVVEMSKKYFKLSEDNKLKVIVEDGRLFLNDTEEKYEIIMVDAYKGGYIPFHLCTKEFYELVSTRLSGNSCMVLNLHSGSKLYPEIVKTVKAVFSNIDIYALESSGNVVLIAYQNKKKNQRELEQTAELIQSKHDLYYNLNKLLKQKTNYQLPGKLNVLTDDFAPINYLNAIEQNNSSK